MLESSTLLVSLIIMDTSSLLVNFSIIIITRSTFTVRFKSVGLIWFQSISFEKYQNSQIAHNLIISEFFEFRKLFISTDPFRRFYMSQIYYALYLSYNSKTVRCLLSMHATENRIG